MTKNENKNGPIVLISPSMTYIFPSGYAYLAGYLVERGEKIKILERPNNTLDYKKLVNEIMDLKPLLVGFGSLYPDLYPTKDIIALLNEAGKNFPIVIGGQMVTPTPEFAVEVTGADIGVIGEGEIILYNLVKALRAGEDLLTVKGLVISLGQEKILTGPGECIEDLSKLPKIPYELFPSTEWLNVGRFYLPFPQPHNQYADRTVTVHGARGCPFRCNFCYHISRPRYRPIDSMMAEAEELIKKFNANHIFFDDDLAIVSPERARQLIAGIKNLSKKIEYSVSIRMDILSRMEDGLLREMKKSGCRAVGPGIESGSQKILDIMDKKITIDQIITGLRRLKNAGLLTSTSIMVGQPGETAEDVQKSIDLVLETLKYDKNIMYSFTICTPFPGSELYHECFRRGIFKSHYDFYNRYNLNKGLFGITANLTAMTDDELIYWFNKLRLTYKLERRKAVGQLAFKIETFMTRADRFDKRLKQKFFDKLPHNFFSKLINKIYNFSYDLMQISFDKLRLYLLGVKKY